MLLSTLLIANSLAAEALPIYLHEVIPAAMAVLVSTLVVMIFGEILPQALCTGPKQFQIAAMSVPVIIILEIICFPVCYPIAKFLDWLLGEDDNSKYKKNKKDLKALIELHTINPNEDSADEKHHLHLQSFGFNKPEVSMLLSTLDLRE